MHPPAMTTVHPARPGSRRLSAATLWAAPRVGAAVPSPDGSCAAVTVVTWDVGTNRSKGRIWLVPAGGAAPRAVTAPEHDSREPRWSPCGRRLAFVRKGPDADAKPQIHLMSLDGEEPRRVTDMPLGAFDARFAPDGKSLVFGAMLLRGYLTVDATRAELARRQPLGPLPVVTEERVFRYWDRWLANGEIPHLFRLDIDSGEVRDLIPASTLWLDWMEPNGRYDISPDGAEIAFGAIWFDERRQLLRGGVFTVPATGGEPRCLTLDHPHDDVHPRYTPDGAAIVWGSQEDPAFYADRLRLRRYDRAKGTDEVVLGDWDLSPAAWEFGADGALWFDAEKDARTSLFRWDGNGPPSEVVRGGSIGGVAPAADGTVWFTSSTLASLPEVFRLAPGATEPRRMTGFTDAALADVALGEVRDVRFAGAYDEPVQMYVVLPPGHDASVPAPTMVVVHGGPHGVSGDGYLPRWCAQTFASWGYVVALVNFQGSTSWGQDFAQRIQGAWGDRPFGDTMRAADTLVALGLSDPARMAAAGASYGGYLVSWIAGHSDRFKCLVNHAGVSDSWNQYASDVTQGRARAFGGEPWDRMEALDRWSPVRYAKNFVTPMLVTHGERDYRVPVGQGLACYSILKAKGVPARLVVFPDENHWVLKPSNSLLWYAEVEAWLARWLRAAT